MVKAMLVWGPGEVRLRCVSTWVDTRGSGFVSSPVDVLEMSVVRGVRSVCGVCEMCMCLARGWVGGECIGFGRYQSCRNKGSVGRVAGFGLR